MDPRSVRTEFGIFVRLLDQLLVLAPFALLFGQFAVALFTFARQLRIGHWLELQVGSRARIVVAAIASSNESRMGREETREIKTDGFRMELWRTHIADCERWHSVSSGLASGLGPR